MKETWRLLRTKPVPKPRPFGVTERAGWLWGVYSKGELLHLSLTYRGAENWRFNCIFEGDVEGWGLNDLRNP